MGRRPKATPVSNAVIEQSNTENNLVESLMAQLNELQKQIQELQTTKVETEKPVVVEAQPKIEVEQKTKIDGRDYIKVMSLSNIPLILTTEPAGRGRLFQFDKFGEIKRVMYDDLIKIVYNHQTFTKSGRFLIMNSDVVKELGYDDDYKNILTKEKIEAILENKQGALDLYKSANDVQKKMIHEFLIRKVRDDLGSVDTALIVAIKQISKIDIIAQAEEIKKNVLDQS